MTRKNQIVSAWALLVVLVTWPVLAQFNRPAGGQAATQATVNAGTVSNEYVSPLTLAGYSLAQSTGSISAATATNIAAYQALIATNKLNTDIPVRLNYPLTNGDTRNVTLVSSNFLLGGSSNYLGTANDYLRIGTPNASMLFDDQFSFITIPGDVYFSGTNIQNSTINSNKLDAATLAKLYEANSGSQTPWTSDINGGGYALTNVYWIAATIQISSLVGFQIGSGFGASTNSINSWDDVTNYFTAGNLTLDASGFNGNLATTDNTLQEVAQKLDDLSTGANTAFWFTNPAAAGSVSNAYSVKIAGDLSVTGTASVSTNNSTNIVFVGRSNAVLQVTSTGALETNSVTTFPITGAGVAATFAQVNSLAPNSGASYIFTNGLSVTAQLSNSLRLSALSYFYPSNVTAGKVLTVTTAGGLTNSGLGAVPINGDTTATTAAQVNTLFPTSLATNGATPYWVNNDYTTNAAAVAAAPIPSFALGNALISTNADFSFATSVAGWDGTKAQTTVLVVSNAAKGSLMTVTVPAVFKQQGTMNVTNNGVTVFTFYHYGAGWTNCRGTPLF